MYAQNLLELAAPMRAGLNTNGYSGLLVPNESVALMGF